jgi:energy-converting hydrogenase A subunit R
MGKNVYITDCEGPISKNDNAFELAERFVEGGAKLFTLISKFDDYLGEIEKIEGYRYGSTLVYILPFLKAAGVTDLDVRGFQKQA